MAWLGLDFPAVLAAERDEAGTFGAGSDQLICSKVLFQAVAEDVLSIGTNMMATRAGPSVAYGTHRRNSGVQSRVSVGISI